MNKHILTVIDNQLNPGKYTRAQLEQNYFSADAVAYSANADNDALADADYYAVWAAADSVYFAEHAAYDVRAEYWLNEYFKLTGENEQDYIDAINKGNKQ